MPRALAIALYVAGRPWTVWPFGLAMIVVARHGGAGGFDAVIVAIGPTVLWFGFSFLCRAASRMSGGPFRRSFLPANKALPAAQLVVVVVPEAIRGKSLDVACAAESTSPDFQRTLRRE